MTSFEEQSGLTPRPGIAPEASLGLTNPEIAETEHQKFDISSVNLDTQLTLTEVGELVDRILKAREERAAAQRRADDRAELATIDLPKLEDGKVSLRTVLSQLDQLELLDDPDALKLALQPCQARQDIIDRRIAMRRELGLPDNASDKVLKAEILLTAAFKEFESRFKEYKSKSIESGEKYVKTRMWDQPYDHLLQINCDSPLLNWGKVNWSATFALMINPVVGPICLAVRACQRLPIVVRAIDLDNSQSPTLRRIVDYIRANGCEPELVIEQLVNFSGPSPAGYRIRAKLPGTD